MSGISTVWSYASCSLITLVAGTSTINITDTSNNAKTFAGGGFTYYNLSFAACGTCANVITGANTFAGTLTVNGKEGLQLPASTTQTITGKLSIVGTASNLVTLTSSSAGTAASWVVPAGVTCINYASLKDQSFSGGTVYAQNSTNVSGNSGVTFGTCPTAIPHHKVVSN
jgi:hypothetical protein